MSLIAELSALQAREGWLSPESLRELASRQRVPLYRLQGLATFYTHFRTSPPPRAAVSVCRDLSCALRGAEGLAGELRAALDGVVAGEVDEVSCLGRCDGAPACAISGVPLAPAAAETAVRLARDPSALHSVLDSRATPPRRFRVDPYATPAERYGVLAGDPDPESVIAGLEEAGLRGLGGAGFPTGQKWRLVRSEARSPKVVICNADESEPGTFKDRVLLAEAPHLVLEGLALAGRTVGAERGIVFIRHEYEPERRALEQELDAATAAGKLRGFPIEIFVSPGGYILGEETALLEALEDQRGEPRNKPPFPGTHGLWGRPTLINNVETLAAAVCITARTAAWWKAQGVRGAAGLKLIAVSGDVERPGVYEIPMGTIVAELIDLAGGVSDGRPLFAFAPGGASSNFLPASRADVPLDFASVQQAGSMLGSGALIVLAEGRDPVAVAENVTRFFARESCGKCVPCRVGTEKAVQLLAARVPLTPSPSPTGGEGGEHAAEPPVSATSPTELEARLDQLHETLRLTSICGLGQIALGPALSLLRNF